jgi:hypothetical protein
MLHPADLGPATLRAELDTLLARPAPALELADYTGAERAVDVLAGLARPATAAVPAVPPAASPRRARVTLVRAAALDVLRRTAALHHRPGARA